MAEPQAASTGPGALLRAARERQGIDIAVLAATLKVPPARLEALEAGRLEELRDVTFARALAASVCRALHLDCAPVLAQLPRPEVASRLEQVASGINQPFRDRAGNGMSAGWAPWRKPALWAAAALVVGAAAFVLLPPRATVNVVPAPGAASSPPASSALPAAASASAAPPVASPATTTPAATAAATTAAAPSAPSAPPADAAPAAAQGAVLTATAATWVQAVDGAGQVLLSRTVVAGEAIELNGTPPLRIRIGNVGGTRLAWHGQPVDLAPYTRDNVANVELR